MASDCERTKFGLDQEINLLSPTSLHQNKKQLFGSKAALYFFYDYF